ncbi:MarR family winged helix-turn-helix transcriptional regulator [Pseudonocardia spinosispora]|uniref:MarR family winged helix-turn-helix transcriptional regulator n=1 Tax=Pseudonocardia spinosispora TaxID=103441 RepID=UPI0004280E18|nr:MarR family transcriptional regulator [Pseudonocardia spinosispora]
MATRSTLADQQSNDAVVDLGVVDGLVQLSFLIQSLLGRVAARHGLSIIQLRLLGVLRDREIGMLGLSRILELEKSSATGLVDRAERRELVRRVPVVGNRRAVHVALSEQGQALARAVHAEVATEITTLTADLSAPKRDQLSRLATTLVLGDAAARSLRL